MGNSARKGQRHKSSPDSAKQRSRSLPPGTRGVRPKTQVLPQDGDVLYTDNDLLQTSGDALKALRDSLNVDAEGFLIDNILMAVQFFQNYEEEASALRKATAMQGAPLTFPAASAAPLPFRVEVPDALVRAASLHVRWRPRGPRLTEPDQPLAATRRLVLNDHIVLDDADCPPPGQGRRRHYHVAVESGSKAGFLKLRRVRRMCEGDVQDDDDVAADLDDDNVSARNAAAVAQTLRIPSLDTSPTPRKRRPGAGGSKSARAASPVEGGPVPHYQLHQILEDEVRHQLQRKLQPPKSPNLLRPPQAQRRGRPRSVVDSVVSSEGSSLLSALSLSLSDLSSGSRMRLSDRQVPLDEFRPGNVCVDLDTLPQECFQSVITQSAPIRMSPYDDDDDDDDEPSPLALRVDAYLMAAPFFAHFTDAFHDHLAAAMDFPRESVVLARVQCAGTAAIQCDASYDDPAAAAAQSCEVTPALSVATWPRAAAEWVYRGRGAWPPRPVVRAVYGLGAVALPTALAGDLHALQWTLAFPAGEQLLELNLPAAQAHTYLTLVGMLRSMPGLSVAHLRALILRETEQCGGANLSQTATSSLGWAPGKALRQCLSAIYIAMQHRHLPDYFVSARNLLAEVSTSQVRRVQERVFRLREKLLPAVVYMCRRLSYVNEGSFYPRLDLDRLVDILTSTSTSTPTSAKDITRSMDLDLSQDPDELDWIANYKRSCEAAAQAAVSQPKRPHLSQASIRLGTNNDETKKRTAVVLKLFCDHFINMGVASIRFKANEQAWVYLRHSLHLLTLLDQDYNCPTEARLFFSRVKRAEKKLIDTAMAKLCGRTNVYGSLGNLCPSPRLELQRTTFGSTSVLYV